MKRLRDESLIERAACAHMSFIVATLFAAILLCFVRPALAQQPKPLVISLDSRHTVVRSLYRDAREYSYFRVQLSRLSQLHRITVVIVGVPYIGAGESIARIFRETFDRAAKDIGNLRPEYEKTNVLMIALSARPAIFALDGIGFVKERLLLNGTNYSQRIRNLQLRTMASPPEALSELPVILAGELKVSESSGLLAILEGLATQGVDNSFYNIALPHTMARGLFTSAQTVIIWLQQEAIATGWVLFGVFVAAIGIAALIAKALTKTLERIQRRIESQPRITAEEGIISEAHARYFLIEQLIETLIELLLALTLLRFSMTVAFGDLLSILSISQMSHHEFGQVFSLAQKTSALSASPPIWLVLMTILLALIAVFVLLLELLAASRLAVRLAVRRRYLLTAVIAAAIVIIVWLAFPLIVGIPGLLVLKGSVAWVVTGTVAIWSTKKIKDFWQPMRKWLVRAKQTQSGIALDL